MVKKIINMSFGSMTTNLYEALSFDTLKKNGLEVEIVDLNKLFFNYDAVKINEYNIITINSYIELEEYFVNNSKENTLFNIQFNYETRFYKFFRLVTKYKCKVSKFEIGYLPTLDSNDIVKSYLKNPVKFIKRVFEKIFDKIIFKTKIINIDYRLRFVAGKKAYDLAKQKNTPKILNINYIDYDKCVELSRNNISSIVNSKKYFVYLDTNSHKNEDGRCFIGIKKRLNENNYFYSLNHFFDYIENKYNVDIVIAAHPKSNYINKEFNHRKIVKDNTAILVKYSVAILTRHSTSVSYGIIYNKPIFFNYTNDERNVFYRDIYLMTKAFSKELNIKAINLDNYDYKDFKLNEVDKKVYSNYKYNYLTSKESENYTNEEILIKWLKNLKSL